MRFASRSPGAASPAASAVATATDNAAAAPTRPEPAMARKLTDVGLRRLFDSDHDLFRESVRRFFNDHVKPHHAQWVLALSPLPVRYPFSIPLDCLSLAFNFCSVRWETRGQVSREVWKAAGDSGLLSVWVPEEYGGEACSHDPLA